MLVIRGSMCLRPSCMYFVSFNSVVELTQGSYLNFVFVFVFCSSAVLPPVPIIRNCCCELQDYLLFY